MSVIKWIIFVALIPLYRQQIIQILVVIPFSFKTKKRINKFWILSVIHQTQDGAFNMSDHFWPIFTLQDKKLYITCLQYSYMIKLHFQYDVIYLPNGCETNAITFVLPSNNKLNVEPNTEVPAYK